MKTLEINMTSAVINTIATAYEGTKIPTSQQLITLYSKIGELLSLQGESSVLSAISLKIGQTFDDIKGFSLRNLRRMRDFYNHYKNSPELMEQTQHLNWTQNIVILDLCQSDEERAFYIELAKKENLSKLALIAAIEGQTYSASVVSEIEENNTDTIVEPVCDVSVKEGTDTKDGGKACVTTAVSHRGETFCQRVGEGVKKWVNRVSAVMVRCKLFAKNLCKLPMTCCEKGQGLWRLLWVSLMGFCLEEVEPP